MYELGNYQVSLDLRPGETTALLELLQSLNRRLEALEASKETTANAASSPRGTGSAITDRLSGAGLAFTPPPTQGFSPSAQLEAALGLVAQDSECAHPFEALKVLGGMKAYSGNNFQREIRVRVGCVICGAYQWFALTLVRAAATPTSTLANRASASSVASTTPTQDERATDSTASRSRPSVRDEG